MGQPPLSGSESEQYLRRLALEIVVRLPLDPEDAERTLVYAHEALATFICGRAASPCVGCEMLKLQKKEMPAPALKLV
jgi:hypothetical protein